MVAPQLWNSLPWEARLSMSLQVGLLSSWVMCSILKGFLYIFRFCRILQIGFCIDFIFAGHFNFVSLEHGLSGQGGKTGYKLN